MEASAGARDWKQVRWSLMGLYVVVTYLALDAYGKVPYDREALVSWIMGLCLLSCLGRARREVGVVLAGWAPFLFCLWAYDYARSVGYRLHRPIIVTPQLELDRWLGFGRLPTEILQGHLFEPLHIRWYDVIVSAVYMSHFLVPYLIAGVLWRDRRRWKWYAGSFVGVTFSACVIFALWATAPPWYAARQGLIEKFPRVIAGRGWHRVGLDLAPRIIDKGQRTVNPFAAIPSLHSAEALLVITFFWSSAPRLLRVLLAIYPLAMGFTLVYSGEHYVVDVLAGWLLVALALTVGWYLRRQYGWTSPFSAVRPGERMRSSRFGLPWRRHPEAHAAPDDGATLSVVVRATVLSYDQGAEFSADESVSVAGP